MGIQSKGYLRFGAAASSAAIGAALLVVVPVGQAKADPDLAVREAVNGVIQNIIQNIRDQVQARTGARTVRPLRFNGEEANRYDDAFASFGLDDEVSGALGYNGMPTKAPRVQPAPATQWIYGANLSGTSDHSRDWTLVDHGQPGTNTSTFVGVGALDITKIGILSASDALTFLVNGNGSSSHTNTLPAGTRAHSEGAGATLAYTSGAFSADFTVAGTRSTSTTTTAGVLSVHTTSESYTPNIQYKIDLRDSWYVEPTIGATWTETHPENAPSGHLNEIHGGARVGTEFMIDTIRLQPSVTAIAYNITSQSGANINSQTGAAAVGSLEGKTGGRGSAKLNIVWNEHFSSYSEAHVSGIAKTDSYGWTSGVRYTW